ncbi:Hydroxypyruvate reductase [Candidatus Calditenuaceae archaeon HR02]|nr:Hydroxypyruvate reductase [Candidatus Calditenuaceae archaeon HR02]
MVERVLIACPFSERLLDVLHEAGVEVDYRPKASQGEFDELYTGYDGLVVRGNIQVRPVKGRGRLKVIVRAGAGVDNIAVEEFAGLGVKVFNTPDAVAESVGELVIGLMISLSRGIVRAAAALSRGEWLKQGLIGQELAGKTLGIIGLGRIGRVVARIAHAMGMRILVYDVVKFGVELLAQYKAEQVDLEKLLSEADYITIHVPLTEVTRGMIGERELRMMKKTAYLINTARGQIIDQEALKRALKEEWIAGAALDVFAEEPPRDLELLSLPNLIPTPHIGAQTKEAQEKAALEAVQILLRELKGVRACP